MTQTTFTRQMKFVIEGILRSYQIDNLQLEIDLFNAIKQLKESPTPARTREDILAGIRGALEAGARAEDTRINMEARVKKCMGLDVSGRSRYDEMIKFLVKKDSEGMPVETFAEWCKNNPFAAPKFYKIAEKPDLLIVNYEAAFTKQFEATRLL